MFGGYGDPVVFRVERGPLLAPLVALLPLAPDDHATIQITMQHVAHRRPGPSARRAIARCRGRCVLGVEQIANLARATATGTEFEDFSNHCRLGLDFLVHDVPTLAVVAQSDVA